MISVPTFEDVAGNAAMARRWFTEGWLGNVGLAEEIFSANFRSNGIAVGPRGPARGVVGRLAAFPGLRVDIEELVAIDDKVIVRLLWQGTHQGMYCGLPLTEKLVAIRVISMWRCEGGKAVENWTIQDRFALAQQVGVIAPTHFRGRSTPAAVYKGIPTRNPAAQSEVPRSASNRHQDQRRRARMAHLDKLLDEALAELFPASDAPSIIVDRGS